MLTGTSGSKQVRSASTIFSRTSPISTGPGEAVAGGSGARSGDVATGAPGGTISSTSRGTRCWFGSMIASLLRRNGLLLAAFERGMERMPGERGALDAGRELADAGKDRQFAEIGLFAGLILSGGNELVKLVKERLGLGPGLPLDALGHERGRRRGDGTTGALEAEVLD